MYDYSLFGGAGGETEAAALTHAGVGDRPYAEGPQAWRAQVLR